MRMGAKFPGVDSPIVLWARRRRKPALTALALVITSALIANGSLPPPPAGSTVVGTPFDGDFAIRLGNAIANTTEGSPWSLVEDRGFGSPDSYPISPRAISGLFPNCTPLWVSRTPIEFAASPPETFPGNLPNWLLVFVNNASEGLLIVDASAISQPSARVVLIAEGPCERQFANLGLTSVPPFDSPQIAFLAGDVGGTRFLGNNTGASQEMTLATGAWSILYTDCSPYDPTGTGGEFVAGYEAGTAELIGAHTFNSTGCPVATFDPYGVMLR